VVVAFVVRAVVGVEMLLLLLLFVLLLAESVQEHTERG
jgi:hypothetical protein